MFLTDDPLLDFARYDAEQNERLKQLPVCSYCEELIQGDVLWDINGELYHTSCAGKEFMKYTEDYIR